MISQVASAGINALFIISLRIYQQDLFNKISPILIVVSLSYAISRVIFSDQLIYMRSKTAVSPAFLKKVLTLITIIPLVIAIIGLSINHNQFWLFLIFPAALNSIQDFYRYLHISRGKTFWPAVSDLSWLLTSGSLIIFFFHKNWLEIVLVWTISGFIFGSLPLMFHYHLFSRKYNYLEEDKFWRRTPNLLVEVLLTRGIAEFQIIAFSTLNIKAGGDLRFANTFIGLVNIVIGWKRLSFVERAKSSENINEISDSKINRKILFFVVILSLIVATSDLEDSFKKLIVVLLITIYFDSIVSMSFTNWRLFYPSKNILMARLSYAFTYLISFIIGITYLPSDIYYFSILIGSATSLLVLKVLRLTNEGK